MLIFLLMTHIMICKLLEKLGYLTLLIPEMNLERKSCMWKTINFYNNPRPGGQAKSIKRKEKKITIPIHVQQRPHL